MGKHDFGGKHTDDKLDRLEKYLRAWAQVMKKQSFMKVYIDAFAGSGDRTIVIEATPLFGAEEITVPGSARRALSIDPPFEKFVLIEKHSARFRSLEALAAEHPDRRFDLRNGDANDVLLEICRPDIWRKSSSAPRGTRGVLFLDPYGMEVRWETLVAIAETRAIDVWMFSPLMGLYRQAPRAAPPALDDAKHRSITAVLGTDAWREEWYQAQPAKGDLFDDVDAAVVRADVDQIERWVHDRLATIFKGAVLPPRRINNERGHPLASLFFAVSNPSFAAVAIAKGIASHILR